QLRDRCSCCPVHSGRGLVGGFVFQHLYTRLYLSPLFLQVERLINRLGQEEVPTQEERVREIARELADKMGASILRYIADVDRITLDHTMHVLSALLYEDQGYLTVLVQED